MVVAGTTSMGQLLADRYEAPIIHGEHYNVAVAKADLPVLDVALRASLPECQAGAWAHLAYGKWYLDSAGEILYEPNSCRLRRISADSARACLTNKTLVFVGGSLSRYQYVNMAFFLSRKKHMQRYDGSPSLVNEKEWSSWEDYYINGSRLLLHADESGSASEECDCHRANLDATTREFRLLTVNITRLGSQPHNGTVQVAYKQAFGIRSNLQTETTEAIHQSFEQFSKFDNTGNGSSTPASSEVIIVVNAGHWLATAKADNYSEFAGKFEPIFTDYKSFVPRLATSSAGHIPRSRLVWKTTTAVRSQLTKDNSSLANSNHERNHWRVAWPRLLTAMAYHHGWSIFDAHYITSEAAQEGINGFWDGLHYHAFMYDQLNDVLLNGLCPTNETN